jgi:hypothetical protein
MIHDDTDVHSIIDAAVCFIVAVSHHRLFGPPRIIDECEFKKPRTFLHLKFDRFGSISWHPVWFSSDHSFSFHIFFPRISNFFDRSITEKTLVVEMRIWSIKIGNVLVLHFNPWVEASAGGLLVPKGLYSPVAKYFGTCFKIRI